MRIIREGNQTIGYTQQLLELNVYQPEENKVWADPSLELGRLRLNYDVTVIVKWARYLNNCQRYLHLLCGDFNSAHENREQAVWIDLAQASNSACHGYINLHLKDLRHVCTYQGLKRVLLGLTLSKISKECCNIMDISSIVRAGVMMGQAGLKAANTVLPIIPEVSSETWCSILRPVDNAMVHSTNTYKVARFCLTMRSTARILRTQSERSERIVQVLEAVMRSIEAFKVCLDICESMNIPAYGFVASSLSPVLAILLPSVSVEPHVVSAGLGLISSMLAVSMLMSATGLHHSFR